MSSLLDFKEKQNNIIVIEDTKKFSVLSLQEEIESLSNGDVEDKIEEEVVSVVEVDGRVFFLDQEASEDDKYKWYEITNGEKVRRNNTDPNLTPDGLLTIENQFKKIEEEELANHKEITEEELEKRTKKDIIMRTRCIALDAMGKNILTDPRSLSVKDRVQFSRRMNELYILSDEEITQMFNKICHESIFAPGADYSSYIVYNA
jgi:hypothetical protein